MNLLSNDVYRFDAMSMFLNAMWTAPLLVVTVGYLLWLEVQWAGMFGLLVVFIIVPIQSNKNNPQNLNSIKSMLIATVHLFHSSKVTLASYR